ncbi:MAG: permease [Epulopiscium sp.]|nr:permease [Candidatus Epulonipiscium sp.]
MDIFTKGLWVITIMGFIISMKKDKKKTIDSMKRSKKMMGSMAGEIISILFLIGLILTFIPPELIKSYLGGSNILLSTMISAFLGSVTLIPAFIAFPLVGSIIDMGASIMPAVAFLTTLTMVGLVTFNLEKKEFGKKFAITRNVFSFGLAIIIAILMGVIL